MGFTTLPRYYVTYLPYQFITKNLNFCLYNWTTICIWNWTWESVMNYFMPSVFENVLLYVIIMLKIISVVRKCKSVSWTSQQCGDVVSKMRVESSILIRTMELNAKRKDSISQSKNNQTNPKSVVIAISQLQRIFFVR